LVYVVFALGSESAFLFGHSHTRGRAIFADGLGPFASGFVLGVYEGSARSFAVDPDFFSCHLPFLSKCPMTAVPLALTR